MLNAPLEQWRVFLHPTQRKLVRMKSNGPVRVLGGAGTGKTVVLMHRAKHLLDNVFTADTDRVLVTTYTKNLALDLEANLKTLCGRDAARLEVINPIWRPSIKRNS
jgi:superfamily I DNA/RNA helicase